MISLLPLNSLRRRGQLSRLRCRRPEPSIAYRLSQGTSPKDLQDFAIRHNLEELLKKAQAAGFRPAERFIETAKWLSPCHKDHTFRYRRRTGRVTLPLPMKVIEIVTMEALLMERIVRVWFMAMQDRTPTLDPGGAA